MDRERSLAALYPSQAQAEAAKKELQRSGVKPEQISMVSPPPGSGNEKPTESHPATADSNPRLEHADAVAGGKFLLMVRTSAKEAASIEEVLKRTVPEVITLHPEN